MPNQVLLLKTYGQMIMSIRYFLGHLLTHPGLVVAFEKEVSLRRLPAAALLSSDGSEGVLAEAWEDLLHQNARRR